MWARVLAGLIARPWARRVVVIAVLALSIVLFLLNLRRAGEHAGRAAERLTQLEHQNALQRQMLEAAARRPRNRNAVIERLRDGQF
jgi:hypothetical protein